MTGAQALSLALSPVTLSLVSPASDGHFPFFFVSCGHRATVVELGPIELRSYEVTTERKAGLGRPVFRSTGF